EAPTKERASAQDRDLRPNPELRRAIAGQCAAARERGGGMNMNHPQKIACLAGSGVGPELMAEAARVLSRLNELHSLAIEEVHVPFAGEAMTRFGHPLPLSTRAAYRKADAILVASPDEPAV